MKLDMEKAYDRLEWKFIDQVMRKFGYNEKWVRWIMYSISTVSFSILINGSWKGTFIRHVEFGKVILFLRLFSFYVRRCFFCGSIDRLSLWALVS